MKTKQEINERYDIANVSMARLVGVIIIAMTLLFSFI